MKYLLSIVFLLVSFILSAQKQLSEVQSFPVIIKSADGIIYGSFFDRIGYNTFGFPQTITILNEATNKKYSFIARSPFNTRKESRFIFYIKAGRYSILNYVWTESKAYGGKMRTEEIYKSKSNTDTLAHERYSFVIEPGKVTYIGAFHFESSLVSFTDEKLKIDSTLATTYKKIKFSEAKVDLPK